MGYHQGIQTIRSFEFHFENLRSGVEPIAEDVVLQGRKFINQREPQNFQSFRSLHVYILFFTLLQFNICNEPVE